MKRRRRVAPSSQLWSAFVGFRFPSGAVLFTFGSGALHVVTMYWISPSFENKSETYGAVGGALALLFWAYRVGRLVTSAAVLNRVLFERRAGNAVGSATPTPP